MQLAVFYPYEGLAGMKGTIKNIRNINLILKYWNLRKTQCLHEICHNSMAYPNPSIHQLLSG